ncbi:hypothetical protein [Nocardia sp. NPDC005998]|uniref:hypothetical protein n=1 Tax=Nocardia sp. NPDC005998 TaxID=3156894 RepID=UPI0033AE123F
MLRLGRFFGHRHLAHLAPCHITIRISIEQHGKHCSQQFRLTRRVRHRDPSGERTVGKRIEIAAGNQHGTDRRARGRAHYQIGCTQIDTPATQFSGQTRHPRTATDTAPTQYNRTPDGLVERSIDNIPHHAAILAMLIILASHRVHRATVETFGGQRH